MFILILERNFNTKGPFGTPNYTVKTSIWRIHCNVRTLSQPPEHLAEQTVSAFLENQALLLVIRVFNATASHPCLQCYC